MLAPFHWGAGLSSIRFTRSSSAIVLGAPVRAFAFSAFGAALVDPSTPRVSDDLARLAALILLPLACPRCAAALRARLMLARAAILSTGDELTTGRIVDTNANCIADKLFELGIDVVAVLTVGDYPERLAWAWRQALVAGRRRDLDRRPRADGRRSHHRDRRARCSGVPLVDATTASPSASARFFAAVGRAMPREQPASRRCFPEGAMIVPNPLGTAPGYRVERAGRPRTSSCCPACRAR